MSQKTGLGIRIRAARRAVDLSVTDAAAALGVKQQQWNKWENEGVVPSDKYRLRIAGVLHVDPVEFLSWIADESQAQAVDQRRELLNARAELSETVKVMRDFVEQYQELGHTYRRLDETSELMLELLREVLDILKKKPGGRG